MNFFLKTIWMIVLIFNFQIATVNKAVASNLNLAQSILPVKFVYLSEYGCINDIWSNVNNQDDVYVVKFFDKEKTELPLTKSLFSQYVQKTQNVIVSKNITQSTQFLTDGRIVEEVTTIV